MSRAYLVGAAILIVLGALSVFTVDQREKAIKLQLGEMKRSDYTPGLHFKLPLFQNVIKFDSRVQTLDSEPQLYLTSEKKNVIVDSFVKWRIQDVERFYTSTGGNPQRANDRLGVTILKRLKDEFGKRTVTQVVSGQRTDIMEKLTQDAKVEADDLGLQLVDVRIKRVDLPEKVSQSVFNRMAAEREQVAKRFRAEGEEQAREIRANADKTREVIVAEAERDGQKIRGDGDARATKIYANAFNQDREFFSLYRSLSAYEHAFNNPADILVVEPNTQFFNYFKSADGRRPEE